MTFKYNFVKIFYLGIEIKEFNKNKGFDVFKLHYILHSNRNPTT